MGPVLFPEFAFCADSKRLILGIHKKGTMTKIKILWFSRMHCCPWHRRYCQIQWIFSSHWYSILI